jgi:hypothetical protein
MLFIMTHQNNMAEAADAFETIVAAILVETKALTFMLKREKIDGLKEKIKKLNDEGLLSSYDHKFMNDSLCFKQSIRRLRYDTKVSTAYLICVILTGAGNIIKPPINFIVFHLILHHPYTAEMPTV